MKRIAVVGAGLGGLAAAIRLAGAGHGVTVFDGAPGPGGKAAERTLGGYRFDTGPSLVTLAEVWDELFASAGRQRQDYLRLTPRTEGTRYFWPSGDQWNAPADAEGIIADLSSRGWAPERALRRWFDRTRSLWDLTGPLFLSRSLHDPATWALPETWATLVQAGRLDSGRTYGQAVDRAFGDPRVRQFFGRFATYNGSDPRRMAATFALIAWAELGLGAWAADDGIHSIPRAMEALARDLGVQFRFSTPVRSLVHDGRTVTGLITDQGAEAFDAVVSNADVAPTYRLLEAGGPRLPRAAARRRDAYARGEPSSSGVVFLWGVQKTHQALGLHNIFFSADYAQEFEDLFDRRRLPQDPTVYVNITSKTTPGDAPPGGENWFVLVNAPHDPGPQRRVGAAEVDQLRRRVLDRVSQALGAPVEPHLAVEAVLTPADLEAATGSPGGSLYGLASHRPLAAFDRHPNRAPGFRGLYLCGGSAHPGGGMPLAVLSGKIAAGLALDDLARPGHRRPRG